jgi:CDP-diacylglycerol--glycerol-3-phosphate 3-phosphatidyltransferase
MNDSRLAWLPNAITLGRLAAVPALAWLAVTHARGAFAVLLALALISDVADGWLARRLGAESPLGSTLDSVADIALMAVILFAIWPLHPEVYREHGTVIWAVVALLALGHLASLLRFGRLASFHTRLIRAGIFTFSVFALVLFIVGFHPWLLYLAAAVCTLGALEHFAMLMLLPEWTPNIHGGLPEVLRRRRQQRSGRPPRKS